jgi:hypothetical protein
MKNIFKKIKKILSVIIKNTQKLLITLLLVIFYIVVFGVTLICLFVFNRKLLKEKPFNARSWWAVAQGYKIDTENILRQS